MPSFRESSRGGGRRWESDVPRRLCPVLGLVCSVFCFQNNLKRCPISVSHQVCPHCVILPCHDTILRFVITKHSEARGRRELVGGEAPGTETGSDSGKLWTSERGPQAGTCVWVSGWVRCSGSLGCLICERGTWCQLRAVATAFRCFTSGPAETRHREREKRRAALARVEARGRSFRPPCPPSPGSSATAVAHGAAARPRPSQAIGSYAWALMLRGQGRPSAHVSS